MNTPDLDTSRYEEEARAAKARIADTVGEIRHRLNPRTIATEAMDAALERGAVAARRARDSAAEHVAGITAVGVGVGLLFGAGTHLKRRRTKPMSQYDDEFEDTHGHADRLSGLKNKAGHVRDTVVEKAGAAREAAAQKLAAAREEVAESWEITRERAGEMAGRARDGARRAREKTSEGIEHNPLTAAFVGAAIGAIVGALLPSTRREDRAVGPARDKLADQARAAARAAREASKTRFEELGIKEQAQAELERLKQNAGDIARKAGEAARATRATNQS